MNAIIFGAGGQDGYYLEQICRSRGIDVIGVSLWGQPGFGAILRTLLWLNGL